MKIRAAVLAAALFGAGCGVAAAGEPGPGIVPKAAKKAGSHPRRWTPTGSFARARFLGAIQKLRDGKVLLVGGLREGVAVGLPDADVYDPASGSWSAVSPLHEGRYEFASVALADGRVLVSGGIGPHGRATGSAEIYDPLAGVWAKAAPMAQKRQGHALALLPDGRVLAAGGWDGISKLNGAEIYDPAKDRWSDAASMLDGRFHGLMVTLRGGKILFSGGSGVATAELYDPAADRWTPAGSMSAARYLHQGGLLPDGRVLAAGGGTPAGATNTADLYDPASNRWMPLPPMRNKRFGAAMTAVSGALLMIGGESQAASYAGTEFYDAGAGAWRAGPRMAGPRSYPAAALLDDGRVLVAAGRAGLGGGTPLSSAEILSASGSLEQSEEPAEPAPAIVQAPPRPLAAPRRLDDLLPPAVAPRPNAHAIVIGIERYREALPRADFAASDARVTAEYFKRVLGVPAENLALLTDDRATKSDFEKYFERWLPNRVEPGDEVFVYFSGHGAPNPKTGASYLVPYDADPTYIEQTGYPIQRLYDRLSKLGAKRVLVALDSCFSGSGGRSVIAKGVRPLVTVASAGVPRPLIVISASAGDQISNTYQEKRHGLFTYFFLEGLRLNGSDLRASFDHLKPRVSRVARREYNSDQHPQWRQGK